ncbi:unnamed protein product [Closterium sp. NIES-54]
MASLASSLHARPIRVLSPHDLLRLTHCFSYATVPSRKGFAKGFQTVALVADSAAPANFLPPSTSSSDERVSLEPYFYYMGNRRGMGAYGVEFREPAHGLQGEGDLAGVGVYAARDIDSRGGARVVMEVPLPLMLSVSRDPPWMFHPDIVPMGHPVFDHSSPASHNREEGVSWPGGRRRSFKRFRNSLAHLYLSFQANWDLRLAGLLLLALKSSPAFVAGTTPTIFEAPQKPSPTLASTSLFQANWDLRLAGLLLLALKSSPAFVAGTTPTIFEAPQKPSPTLASTSLFQANWDLRLACLLLLALNSSLASRGREDAYGSKRPHFLTEYADFLPSPLDCPSLLLSSEV